MFMAKDFSKTIEDYQKSRISTRDFLREIGIYILKFPFFHGYKDEDLRHEFFAYVVSKIRNIIMSYEKYENSSFLSWFNTVLKHQFFSFMKKYNSEKSLMDQFNCDFYENEEIYSASHETDHINIDLSHLSGKERRVVALKYGLSDSMFHTDYILKRIERKKMLEERISKKFFNLIRIHNELSTELDPERKKRLFLKEDLLKKNKRKLESALSSLSFTNTNEWVGSQLSMNAGTVATYLKRAKTKLKRAGLNNILR
jgi:hypothetical protein